MANCATAPQQKCAGSYRGRPCGRLIVKEGKLQCPRCKMEVAVDFHGALRCPLCNRKLAVDGVIKCPKCGEKTKNKEEEKLMKKDLYELAQEVANLPLLTTEEIKTAMMAATHGGNRKDILLNLPGLEKYLTDGDVFDISYENLYRMLGIVVDLNQQLKEGVGIEKIKDLYPGLEIWSRFPIVLEKCLEIKFQGARFGFIHIEWPEMSREEFQNSIPSQVKKKYSFSLFSFLGKENSEFDSLTKVIQALLERLNEWREKTPLAIAWIKNPYSDDIVVRGYMHDIELYSISRSHSCDSGEDTVTLCSPMGVFEETSGWRKELGEDEYYLSGEEIVEDSKKMAEGNLAELLTLLEMCPFTPPKT